MFAGALLVGNSVTEWRMDRYRRRTGGEPTEVSLVKVVAVCFLAVSLSVIVATVYDAVFVFMLAMISVQLLNGVFEAPLSGVENAWIPSQHPMRATILSTIEAARNVIVGGAFLVVPFSEDFEKWQRPAIVLLFFSLCLFVFMMHLRRQKSSLQEI